MNTALATRQEEQVTAVVPRYLIHFKLKLFVDLCFIRLCVDECDEIFLVADGDGAPVGRPADVEILSWWMERHIADVDEFMGKSVLRKPISDFKTYFCK